MTEDKNDWQPRTSEDRIALILFGMTHERCWRQHARHRYYEKDQWNHLYYGGDMYYKTLIAEIKRKKSACHCAHG